jgi:hypothetical protein
LRVSRRLMVRLCFVKRSVYLREDQPFEYVMDNFITK